jgi:hypothetical protein
MSSTASSSGPGIGSTPNAASPRTGLGIRPSRARILTARIRRWAAAITAGSLRREQELIDTQDQGYTEAIYESPPCHPIGSGVKYAPESKRVGCLIFEVGKRAKPAVSQFTMASGFADETGEWRLD